MKEKFFIARYGKWKDYYNTDQWIVVAVNEYWLTKSIYEDFQRNHIDTTNLLAFSEKAFLKYVVPLLKEDDECSILQLIEIVRVATNHVSSYIKLPENIMLALRLQKNIKGFTDNE